VRLLAALPRTTFKTITITMVPQNKATRKRKLLAAATLLLDLDSTKKSRAANKRRQRLDWFKHVGSIDERLFTRAYRLSPATFDELLNKIRPALEKNETQAQRSSSSRIEPETRLAATLRYLAGGSYLDICFTHGIAIPSFYDCVWQVMGEINRVETIKFPTTDEAALKRISLGFESRTSGTLYGCVGALDGLCIRIRKPRAEETGNNPGIYHNRKGFWSINLCVRAAAPVHCASAAAAKPPPRRRRRDAKRAPRTPACMTRLPTPKSPDRQATCDSEYRFTFSSMQAVGQTHDSSAFGYSDLSKDLEAGLLPAPFWISADDAYCCSESLCTPYPGKKLGKEKDTFNHFQSNCRIKIEQASGHLRTPVPTSPRLRQAKPSRPLTHPRALLSLRHLTVLRHLGRSLGHLVAPDDLRPGPCHAGGQLLLEAAQPLPEPLDSDVLSSRGLQLRPRQDPG